MHMWIGIPTRYLHYAVGYMDLYMWCCPGKKEDLQLAALAGLIMAFRKWKPDTDIHYDKVVETVGYSFSSNQVCLSKRNTNIYFG